MLVAWSTTTFEQRFRAVLRFAFCKPLYELLRGRAFVTPNSNQASPVPVG